MNVQIAALLLLLSGFGTLVCGQTYLAPRETPKASRSGTSVQFRRSVAQETAKAIECAAQATPWKEDGIPSAATGFSDAKHEASARIALAQTSFLLGRKRHAIEILEQAVTDYPRETPPNLKLPLRIVGRMWIGTYARHIGDVSRAEKAYASAIKQIDADSPEPMPALLKEVCYLYLAEIESEFRNRSERSIQYLRAIESTPPAKNARQEYHLQFYRRWANHQIKILEPGDSEAGAINPIAPAEYGARWLAIAMHCTICGMGDNADLTTAYSDAGQLFFEWPLEISMEGTASQVDWSVACFQMGYFLQKRRLFKRAEEYYSRLFSSKVFLAPDAGLCLAHTQKALKEDEAAKDTLRQVAARFPEFGKIARAQYGQWFGMSDWHK